MKAIKNHLKMKPAEPVQKVKLPFKCSTAFTDPYNYENDAGYGFSTWPHDSDADQLVYIYNVCLRDAAELPSMTKVRKATLKMDANLSAQYED